MVPWFELSNSIGSHSLVLNFAHTFNLQSSRVSLMNRYSVVFAFISCASAARTSIKNRTHQVDEAILDLDALVEAESENGQKNATGPEDVECFCIDPYIYADLDDEDTDPQRCESNTRHRCNEVCERKN